MTGEMTLTDHQSAPWMIATDIVIRYATVHSHHGHGLSNIFLPQRALNIGPNEVAIVSETIMLAQPGL